LSFVFDLPLWIVGLVLVVVMTGLAASAQRWFSAGESALIITIPSVAARTEV
jgi:hypothetical protein